MRYSAKYFRESMPEWKKKKDPLIGRYFLRPISFYFTAFAANHNISANTVSYVSIIFGLLGCGMYFFNSYPLAIVGAILMIFWSILDCVDGNLARSVKMQPFGEFADGISGYSLVAFMGVSIGYYAYMSGGIISRAGNPWLIVIGSISSTFDILARLIYQKYKNTENDLVSKGIIPAEVDDHTDHAKVSSLRIRFEQAGGIGGWLTILVFFATVFKALDLIIAYCIIYFGITFFAGSFIFIRRAIKKAGDLSIKKEE